MKFADSSAGFQTDCNLWEYILVAQPDEEVNEKIWSEREFFCNHYSLKTTATPHITIASFLSKEPMEDILARWIQNICNLHTSFGVTLNNFSGLPPHCIYARVQDPDPFKKLATALKIIDGFIQSNDCPPLQLVTKPRLVIVEALPEHIYNEAIKEYAQRSFHASFKVERLLLFKRDASMQLRLVNTFILPPSSPLFD